MQDIVREEYESDHLLTEKHLLPGPWAIMPVESNFPKYLQEASGHQTPYCKHGHHSKAETIALLENKINSL